MTEQCPFCGTEARSWEYGRRCPNDSCPVRELVVNRAPDSVTVVVPKDQLSRVAEPLLNKERVYQCQFCGRFDETAEEHEAHVNAAHGDEL